MLHGFVLQFAVAGKNDIQGGLVPVRYGGASAELSTGGLPVQLLFSFRSVAVCSGG